MNGLQKAVFKIIEAFWSLPRFLRFGVLVFVISAALDLSYHIFSSFWPGRLDAVMGPDGYYAHLALFLGMLLIVIGIIRIKPQPAYPADITTNPQSNDRR